MSGFESNQSFYTNGIGQCSGLQSTVDNRVSISEGHYEQTILPTAAMGKSLVVEVGPSGISPAVRTAPYATHTGRPGHRAAWLAVARFIGGGLLDGLMAFGATQQGAEIILFASGTLWLCVTVMLAALYAPPNPDEL